MTFTDFLEEIKHFKLLSLNDNKSWFIEKLSSILKDAEYILKLYVEIIYKRFIFLFLDMYS